MSEPDKSGDTSMDEILASIRRIISDEPGHERPDRRAVNPLIEPPRKPGFMGLAPARDARPLPPADRLSEALRASALNVSSAPAGPSHPGGIDSDLEDLLEGPPEPLAPIEPMPERPASSQPGPLTAPPDMPPAISLEEPDTQRVSAADGLDLTNGEETERAEQSAKAIAAALTGDAIEAPVTVHNKPTASAHAPASPPSPVPDLAVTASARSHSLNSFPSLPGDGERTLSYTAVAASIASAPPTPAAAVAVPLTPAEATHAASVVAGGTSPTAPLPAAPRAGFPFAPATATPPQQHPSATTGSGRPSMSEAAAPAARPLNSHSGPSAQPLPPLDRDTQAAAAMALGALAAGLAASPPSAGSSPTEAPPPATAARQEPAAPVSVQTPPQASQPIAPASAPAAAPAQATTPARTLEDIVADMVRPMLEKWISDNMPRIMEKALRGEMKGKKP